MLRDLLAGIAPVCLHCLHSHLPVQLASGSVAAGKRALSSPGETR